MAWLAGGVFAFSFVVGALAGTHNVPLLGSALFAIAGAVTTLLAFMQKFFNERAAIAASESSAIPAFNTSLAISLGKVLLTLSAGFCAGVYAGNALRQDSPLFLAENLPTPVPWSQTAGAPDSLDDAVAWLALSDRMRRAGLSEKDIRAAYGHFKEKKATPSDKLKTHGERWLEGNAPARQSPSATTVPASTTAPATANPAPPPADKPKMPVPDKK